MFRERDLLRLTATAHEAAATAEVWPTFLERYAHAIDADIVALQYHDLSNHRSTVVSTFGMQQRFTDSYNQHYARLNVWRDNGRRLYEEGRVLFDEEIYPRALLKRTEFYNDFLLPNRGTRGLAGVVARSDDDVWVLSPLRDDPRESFDKAGARTTKSLLPHLKLALAMRERLQTLEAGEAVLHALSQGVVMIGADARVLFCNSAAEGMFRARDGLTVEQDIIHVADHRAANELRKLLHLVLAPGESLDAATPILVPRLSLRRPYHVMVAPLRRTLRTFVGLRSVAATMFITDPEQRVTLPVPALRQMFGLTGKEAMLANELSRGYTVEQAAERLGVRYETARTHLRRVLSKTRTSRQVELLTLLDRLAHRVVEPE
jgi:DNA-binding CsgD family transcriptional regulator